MAQGTDDDVAALFVSPKLARALANPWRSRILMELSARPMSPSQFVEEVGGELTTIARAFRQLASWEYIAVVDERRGGRRRGGVEHVYRTVERAYIDTATWERLPRILRDDFSQNILASYFKRITEALETGTFDAETDRHLSWDSVALDRIAWEQLGERLDEVLDWLPKLAAESVGRSGDSEEGLIPVTVGLAAFRSPTESELKDSRTGTDHHD